MNRGITFLFLLLGVMVIMMAHYGDGHHGHKHTHGSGSKSKDPHTHGSGSKSKGPHTHGSGSKSKGPHTHGHPKTPKDKSKSGTDKSKTEPEKTPGTPPVIQPQPGNEPGGNIGPVYIVYISCQDAYNKGQTMSGVYTIQPDGQEPFEVYCDMETEGGGWTVVQRRVDVSVNFYLGWQSYVTGFGNLNGDLWLGLRYLYRLANSNTPQELRIDLTDFSGHAAYADYKTFYISGESSGFTLYVSGYRGSAGDSLSAHSGAKFSTKDHDNDQVGSNCAAKNHGAWWYKGCSYQSSLNGEYYAGGVSSALGIVWYQWKSSTYSCKYVEMKIRPATTTTKG